MLTFKSHSLTVVALAAVFSLAACDAGEPRINAAPLLLAPESSYSVGISGVGDLTGLSLAFEGDDGTVEATLVDNDTIDDGTAFWPDEAIQIRALRAGRTTVQLRHRGDLVGAIDITVAPVHRVTARPLDGGPRLGDDYGLLAGSTTFFTVTAQDDQGREFDRAFEGTGEFVAGDPSVTLPQQLTLFGRSHFAIRADAPGTHTVLMLSDTNAEVPFSVRAVGAHEITSLELVADDGGRSFYVRGVTAAGTRVVGIDAAFTVAGAAVETNGVITHAISLTDAASPGTVVASWDGLSATW